MDILRLRKFLFYLFVAIYIIFCPLIILRALGILFKPNKPDNIVQTGLIHVATIPPDATVTINGIPFPEGTPTSIRNLTPGTYSLHIALPNYRPVDKTAVVAPAQATRFEPILLIPNDWSPKTIANEEYQNLSPVPDNPFFLVSKGNKIGDLFIYRAQKSIEESLSAIMNTAEDRSPVWPLFAPNSLYLKNDLAALLTTNNSPFLLLQVRLPNEDKYLWVDPRPAIPLVKDISDLVTGKPERLAWDPEDSTDLFTFQNDYINLLDINAKAIFPKVVEGIKAFGLHDKKIYALTKNQHLLRLDKDGTNKEEIKLAPRLNNLLGQTHGGLRLGIFSPEDIFFLTDNGTLLSNRFPYSLIDRDCQNYQFNADTKRLLVWTKTRVGIIDLHPDTDGDDGRKTDSLAVNWLFDKAKRVDQAIWVNKGTHILFTDQGKVFLLEAQAPGNPSCEEILKIRRGTTIDYSEPTGKIFFIDDNSGRLTTIRLLPTKKNPPKPKNGQPAKTKG